MNEIREIVTRAVVAKGKKVLDLTEKIYCKDKIYSILGCWIINHEFEATKINNVVKLDGEFEVNIWYSTLDNTKTDILKDMIYYKKDVTTRQIVKGYLDNSDEILARILEHPTVINAKIDEDGVTIDVSFEVLAEIIGETKMKVTILKEEDTLDDEIDAIDMDINEHFLT